MGGGGAERQVSYLFSSSIVNKIFVLQNDCSYDISPENLCPLFGDTFRLGAFGIVKSLIYGPLKFAFKIKSGEKVISFLELSNFINILSKIFKPHEAFVSVRISPQFYNKKKLGFLYKFLMKLLYPYATKIITNSEQCRLELLNLTKFKDGQIIVIKNALDIEKIINLSKTGLYSQNSFEGYSFVTIGRLSYQKNYPAMLRIFSILKKNLKKARLIIVGEGKDRKKLEKLAQSLGLSTCHSIEHVGDVFFIGFHENPYQFINDKSIFLLTSYYEGLPNVLLEAMACGAFIVSSDCKTGPREILTKENLNNILLSSSILGENGLLLPVPNDTFKEELWTKEILKIIDKKETLESIRKKAAIAATKYQLDRVMTKWASLL